MKPFYLLSFFNLFFCCSSFSQGLKNDTISGENVKESIELYDRFMGAQASIYNGSEYLPFNFKKVGIPFFEADTMSAGWVGYDDRIYQTMHIQYDVSRNQVVILNYDKRSKIILHNELVDSFQFLDHTFLKLKANSQQNLSTTGFYDLLYNGNLRVFANRKKSFKEEIKDNEVVRTFYSQNRYYVYKVDKYYLVNNKKDVFNLFNNRKHEIKTVMRQRKIKFRKSNFEQALLMAATIYDQH